MPSTGVKTLVTGGAGFIGSNLVRRARSSAATTVRVLDNLSTGQRANLAGRGARGRADRGRPAELRARAQRRARHARSSSTRAALPSVPRSVQDPLTTQRGERRRARSTCCSRRATRACGASCSPRRRRSTATAPSLPTHRTTSRRRRSSPYAVAKLAAERYCRQLLARLRARDRLPALLQRLRPAPGPRARSTRR